MAFTLPYINKVRLRNGLFIVVLTSCTKGLMAQRTTVKTTDEQANAKLAKHFREKYANNRIRAFQLASQHNWPTIKNYANGKTLTLEGIDSLGFPIYYTTHNILSATGTQTGTLYENGGLGVNLDGGLPEMEGKLGIWDGGQARLTHVEFGGRLKQQDLNSSFNDHTTHLAGTMAASGINPQIKGMAYRAKLSVWNYTDDLAEMAAASRSLLVSNHAYGPIAGWFNNPDRLGNDPNLKWEWWGTPNINPTEDYRFGFYDDKTRDLDKLAFNSPYYLIVKSADNKRLENGPPAGVPYFLKNSNTKSTIERSKNDGYDVIPTDATAKNILTVGATEATFGSGKMTNFKVASFSGWGPTDDGRIKPDLLGVGTNVISSIASSNNSYGTYSGTSMASANVSGTLFLLQELYFKQTKTFMRSATLKALALHTADKPDGKIRPSYEYGWGLLNAKKAAEVLLNTDQRHIVSENTLINGETISQKLISASNEPLVATLVWTDPEADPTAISSKMVNSRNPKLINDLDIRIVDEANKDINWLPWTLDPANPSLPAVVGDNIRDNVEQIYIPPTASSKTYSIIIKHKNRLTNASQPYSLIISGVEKQDCFKAARLIAGRDTVLCSGGKMKLEANGGEAFVYEWRRNGDVVRTNESPSFEIAKDGIYQLTVKGYNCSAQSKQIIVQSADLTARVTPSGAITVCTATPTRLSTIAGDYKYQWYRNDELIENATSAFFDASDGGKYSVSVTDKTCTAKSAPTQLISLTQKPSISTNSGTKIPVNGSIHLITTSDENISYKWFLDGKVIPTATAARLVATKAGNYVVELTQNGCTLKSKALRLTNSGIENGDIINFIEKKDLLLYPNPSSSKLTVVYQSDKTYNLEATIVDERGILLEHKPLNDDGNVFKATFDVSNLPNGHFLMVVYDGHRKIAKPFVKN